MLTAGLANGNGLYRKILLMWRGLLKRPSDSNKKSREKAEGRFPYFYRIFWTKNVRIHFSLNPLALHAHHGIPYIFELSHFVASFFVFNLPSNCIFFNPYISFPRATPCLSPVITIISSDVRKLFFHILLNLSA